MQTGEDNYFFQLWKINNHGTLEFIYKEGEGGGFYVFGQKLKSTKYLETPW